MSKNNMPFKSKQQSKWAFATDQPFAKEWAKKTDYSKIPKKASKKSQSENKYGRYLKKHE